MSFAETIQAIDVPVVDDNKVGPPRIWWYNGNKAARTLGRFYTRLDEVGTEPSDPWLPSNRFENEDGYDTPVLRLAIIGYRQQAFRRDEDRRIWLDEWTQGAQLYTETLCFVEGIDEPVVWASKGLTGRAVTGKGGILSTYRAGLLREAERKAKKRLPLWTFWLPIGTQLDQHGRPAYTSTGYSANVVTLPALHLPHDDVGLCLHELFVGKEMLSWGAEVRQEFDAWFKQRRGNADANSPAEEDAQKETALVSADTDDEGEFPI